MDRRDIIEKTMENMRLIYDDVGKVVQIIEEKMQNRSFKPLSNSAVTWEISTSLWNPDLWQYRWFARAYFKSERRKRTVGFCIHLGAYDRPFIDDVRNRPGFLPFINVSLLDLNQKPGDLRRTDVYECLWSAGWDKEDAKDIALSRSIVRNKVARGTAEADAVTYFVDLLSLTDDEAIEQLVVEPMAKMFEGDEEWVERSSLQVVQLHERTDTR